MDPNIKFALGIIAGVIAFCTYVIYIASILKGETKPNLASWWIWTFMSFVLVLSYYFSGARNTIWVPTVEFLGPLSIALLSIKRGEGGYTDKTDLFCLVGVVVSVILWVVFNSPVIALISNLVIDAFAFVPTIKKSYLRPRGENLLAWSTTGLAEAVNLFAMERFTFNIAIYPVYMLVADIVLILLLIRGRVSKSE